MAHAFRILNVFTIDGDRFSGNPLAVFEDGRGLTTEQMQAIALQLNLSETTFILPSERADARVRIFTPAYEMPFAGHPTLGTASVVGATAGRDRVTLELIAGLVPVARGGDGGWTLRAAKPPETRAPDAAPADLARMLGLPAEAIRAQPLWVSTGVEQLVIPLATAAHVRAARPDPVLLDRWARPQPSVPREATSVQAQPAVAPASRSNDGHLEKVTVTESMAYVWAPEGDEWPVRFFFGVNGAVLEDPATGSACANLGGWWLATQGPLPLRATLRQGDAIRRPSRLGLRVDEDRAIHVTGAVIELGRGTIDV